MTRARAIRVERCRTSGARSEKKGTEFPLKSEEIRPVSIRVESEDVLKHRVHMAHLIGIQRQGREMKRRHVTVVHLWNSDSGVLFLFRGGRYGPSPKARPSSTIRLP